MAKSRTLTKPKAEFQMPKVIRKSWAPFSESSDKLGNINAKLSRIASLKVEGDPRKKIVKKRLKTYVKTTDGKKSLDDLIGGGLPYGTTLLLTGKAGTGKTILAGQIAFENAKNGVKCMYVSFEQPSYDIIEQMDQFGIKMDSKNLVLHTFDVSRADLVPSIFKKIQDENVQLVVVDSLAALSEAKQTARDVKEHEMTITEVAEKMVPTVMNRHELNREKIKAVIEAMKSSGITSILINEIPEDSEGLSREGLSDFLCDGIFVMNYLGVGGAEFRSIKIRKLRRSNHEKDNIPFEIGKNGIQLRLVKALEL